MKEFSVIYRLSEENEKRLQKIQTMYCKQGVHFTEEQLFEFIMVSGSVHDIESKFEFHESMLLRQKGCSD